MKEFRLLALGDVVGPDAVKAVGERLWGIRKKLGVNMVVCNAENACVGNGLDPASADRLLSAGCDVLTGGNHTFRKKEIRQYLDDSETVLRPANFPAGTAGNGCTILEIDGVRVLTMNLLGTVYLDALACPFETAERILKREEGQYDLSVLDIHAEATSEKLALGYHFDGRLSVVFGTHTHVATADAQVLPRGTGYMTDLGMSGPPDGILGVRPDLIIEKMRTKMPVKFEFASGRPVLNGCLFTLDLMSGKCLAAERFEG